MDLFVEAADDRDRSLPVTGFKGTPEQIEQQWYEQVYRGRGDSMAQLTWRSVLIGSCLGGVLSLTNLYIGLKAGWGFGVAITASILSYAIWTSLLKVGLARTPMTILENNCMQSTASSAGYSTGGTLISAFAAYIIINHQSISVPLMLAWVFFIAVLGVTMAIPMKRQMINIEQLRFPSGIAAAETLRALHVKSSQGLRAAKALGLAGLIAALDKAWAEGLSTIRVVFYLVDDHRAVFSRIDRDLTCRHHCRTRNHSCGADLDILSLEPPSRGRVAGKTRDCGGYRRRSASSVFGLGLIVVREECRGKINPPAITRRVYLRWTGLPCG
jgi:OPT oligopeptide transporter protein